MNVTIKLLDAAADRAILAEAWKWHESAPRWFRATMDLWDEKLNDFLESAKDELLYGIFIDRQITAVIRLIPTGVQIYDAHLYAKRHTPLDVLTRAAMSIKAYLFDHDVKIIYGWIPRINRGVVKLYRNLGFVEIARCEKGEIGGKPVEWLNMLATKNS